MTGLRSASRELEDLVPEIDAALAAFVSDRAGAGPLAPALRYACEGGGKRLRPALVLLACRASGGATSGAMPAAVAIELVHTFSLVHDDLPALDDDDLRRGRPTLHRAFDEATALLAGDALLALAFEAAAAMRPDALAAAAVRELAVATNAMIVGQGFDSLGGVPAELAPEAILQLVHGGKTGALIRAAVRLGGLAAGADGQTLERLDAYGRSLGLMFQAVDDLLDATASTEQLGKRTGKDAQRGVPTWPGLLGLEATRTRIDEMRCEAIAAVEPLGERGRVLARLADDMAARQR